MIHIKEVAKQTDITVRTLRYYDQIGLLTAPAKTEGGHRLYSEEELRKLQYIQFLKGMGYSLQDIKDMLLGSDWDWLASLQNQLVCIMEEQQRLKQIESSLRELINGIIVEGGDERAAVQKLIRLSHQHKKRVPGFKESLFNEREIQLLEKVPKMNGEDPDSMEWIALLGQLKQHMKDGPDSPKVQNIIRRMLEKQAEEFKDEDEFIDKLWESRKSPKQSEMLGLYPIEKEVLEFMEQAYDIYMASFQETTKKGRES
ncbi:MerR family transcriptional regulator [Paenibacillus donghaensis]|uniref:MerR family transcriptional regulator n=1 Tax=Paenibacillus donghaensis TaxID=414771 RepID=UPI00188446A7|nr:MerR family transcriptional regulator [Paenibacillus donghaensis]MBE9917423.1 MerR family transcriptional regulator [Paenibacillus donghaensis]